MSAYDELVQRLKRISGLEGAAGVLRWDQETYMPDGGTEARAHQLSVLDTLSHELFTDETMGDLLDQSEEAATDTDQEALLRETRWAWEREVRVPGELVERLSEATSRALPAWVKAREASDWSAFAPHLETIVELKREQAAAIDPNRRAYEVLFEAYEPWLPWDQAREILFGLPDQLAPFLEAAPDPSELADPFEGTWPEAGQRKLSDRILGELGYDWEHGRLDVSAHPFSTGNAYDARVTTRFDEEDLVSALTSTIHEFGHALYTQGLPREHHGTPLGQARDLVVHESQSRLWENHVARSLPFWHWALDHVQAVFGDQAGGILPEEAWQAVNVVQPSLIRVEADELTYHLHIVIRTKIEEALIDGSLEVDEVPQRWDELMEETLGLTPPTVSQGALQDVHWSHGAIGYFPTYSLGSLLAAQLFATYEDEQGPADADIGNGRFEPLADWLQATIHKHGKRYTTPELIERATGRPLDTDAFLGYAADKFGELWGTKLP